MKKLKKTTWGRYVLITLGTLIISIGVYFFKFPNNFSFGGVTGIAVVLAKITPWSASNITFALNMILLIFAFSFIGKGFGMKTIYSSVLLSVFLYIFEYAFPMDAPLTDQTFLEFTLAVFLPAIGAAMLFNVDASGGGTDIIAVIIKKWTGMSVGTSLLIIDAIVTISTFAVFNLTTGLYALTGLLAKTYVINIAIDHLNLNKYFNIICDNPEPICEYIHKTLHHSATITEGKGAYTKEKKYIITTALSPDQSLKLRNKVNELEPKAFMLITNSSEIVGKGFM